MKAIELFISAAKEVMKVRVVADLMRQLFELADDGAGTLSGPADAERAAPNERMGFSAQKSHLAEARLGRLEISPLKGILEELGEVDEVIIKAEPGGIHFLQNRRSKGGGQAMRGLLQGKICGAAVVIPKLALLKHGVHT